MRSNYPPFYPKNLEFVQNHSLKYKLRIEPRSVRFHPLSSVHQLQCFPRRGFLTEQPEAGRITRREGSPGMLEEEVASRAQWHRKAA